MNQQDTQSTESSQPNQGPGDILQAARISNGMTLEDVANKMHLSRGILNSLEENNFEDITAPIFVKGYLRSYSRLVNVDENEIIEQYATYYMNGDPPISSTSNTSPELNANDSKIKWITYLIIVGLIVILSIWWWNRYQQAPEMVSLETENEVQAGSGSLAITENKATANPTESEISPEVADSPASDLQLEIKQASDSVEIPQQLKPQIMTEKETEVPPGTTVSAVRQFTATAESVEVSTTDTVPAVDSSGEVSNPADVTTEQSNVDKDTGLLITVTADTWASIKDADGKKLVYDLLKKGEQLTVNGKTPIRVFLGNGNGVNMTFNGKEVNLQQVIKSDNTARIKLGQ